MKKDREASTSITHLVKIISEEVFEENSLPLLQRISNLEEKATQIKETKPRYSEDRIGFAWSDFEEKALIDSLYNWVTETAKEHGRNVNGILTRLDQISNRPEQNQTVKYIAKLFSGRC